MNKIFTGLAVTLAMTATQAFAADGQLSQSGLEAFGLSGLQVVSDADGMAIRGQRSFAFVGGGSYSARYSSATGNVYAAGASHRRGSSRANGDTSSTSFISNTRTLNIGGFSASYNTLHETGSFGGSSAYAR